MERQRENELKRMHNPYFILHFFQRLASQVWRHRIIVALLIVVAIFATEFYALKLPKANAAYTIANSARFISGNSDNLSKTLTTPTNNKIWTLSFWMKRGAISNNIIFDADTANRDLLEFSSSNVLTYQTSGGGIFTTTQVFRDPAAWQHI